MPAKDPVHVAFDRFGRDAGMELFKRRLYLRAQDVTVVCELQRSQYGHSYYLNLHFVLNEVGAPNGDEVHPFPGHVRLRAEYLTGNDELPALLDLDSAMAEDERLSLLAVCLSGLSAQLDQALTTDGLRALAKQGVLRHAFVDKRARAVLMTSPE